MLSYCSKRRALNFYCYDCLARFDLLSKVSDFNVDDVQVSALEKTMTSMSRSSLKSCYYRATQYTKRYLCQSLSDYNGMLKIVGTFGLTSIARRTGALYVALRNLIEAHQNALSFPRTFEYLSTTELTHIMLFIIARLTRMSPPFLVPNPRQVADPNFSDVKTTLDEAKADIQVADKVLQSLIASNKSYLQSIDLFSDFLCSHSAAEKSVSTALKSLRNLPTTSPDQIEERSNLIKICTSLQSSLNEQQDTLATFTRSQRLV